MSSAPVNEEEEEEGLRDEIETSSGCLLQR
jgi:hypothetical protein